MAHAYTFRPMTTADMPLIRRWLDAPHVAEWWHDPETLEFVGGDLDHPDLAQFIVSKDGRPLAYLQCYQLGEWHLGFGPQPTGTRGLDQFIGEADMLGCGHGSGFIRTFTDELFARGVPRIVIDPSPANTRAIRAYEKAGFVPQHVIVTPDGPALLMIRDP
ncbi:aminoglycoside 6'-N-acetyltransferase [Bradyrhizobium sp. R2.2-H]|jgi:aminoglycoside 6'-N-acetyltransferase|uniref:GNAT family N-acetyltransferase n=1 Tax=unclassified Bradyrhizobium TaxID=2631580 RepID=UPI00104E1643|nr:MULTISPECIES: GNAT family N-acetyltransferase [unclassified Bradyrhizobium]TCU70478.1 aminoglycoside 6'-N-acetyltransferase [Bradyrhizobium sp. Y-H1]TCU72046.1 aminoglycoside 6'-N-acetyltransferase [Bradyrhizobium sp. R2.2-H]